MPTRRGLLMLALGLSLAPLLSATQIMLVTSDVVGYFGQYSALFPATAIVDQQTGSISEPTQTGYWLNSNSGPANAYIVIDLGAAYNISWFELFNTHNSRYNDRGTGNFTIEASNTLVAGGPGSVGNNLGGTVVTLVTGTLLAQSLAGDPLDPQTFTSSDTATYRYIRFSPHSVAASGTPCCGTNVYGLNELRVFESGVPEPLPVTLLGFGLAALALLRRNQN